MRRVLLAASAAAVTLAACGGGGQAHVQPTSIPISADCRDAFAALETERGEDGGQPPASPETPGETAGETGGETTSPVGPASPVPTIAPGSVADLIPTVQACDSVEEWIEAYRSNPGSIQLAYEPITVLRSLCSHAASAEIEGAGLCTDIAARPEAGPVTPN